MPEQRGPRRGLRRGPSVPAPVASKVVWNFPRPFVAEPPPPLKPLRPEGERVPGARAPRTVRPAAVAAPAGDLLPRHEDPSPEPVAAADPAARPAWLRRPWLLAVLLGVGALVVRLWNIDTAYSVFIDEATYVEIARSVGNGEGVKLHGEPFILHPPLSFLLMGVASWWSGEQSILRLVLDLRPYAAVFGALAVVVTTAAVWAAGARRAAVVTGLLLALDPFGLSFDGRVMLESTAQVFAALTFLALVLATRDGGTGRCWPAVAATAGAATFVTKETFGLVVCAAIFLLFLLRVGLPRRATLIATAGASAGYLAVNGVVASAVGLGVWWESRTAGLARLLGTHKITGFGAPGVKVSLWSRVADLVGEFGVSYLLLAAGGLGALLVLFLARRRPDSCERLFGRALVPGAVVLSAWTVAACCYLAYAVGFGSLEEQMFYIPLAPCVASSALLGVAFLRRTRVRRVAGCVALAAALAVQTVQYVHVRTQPDAAYLDFMAWLPQHVAPGSRIAATEETAQFIVEDQQVGQWNTLEQIREQRVDYVLIASVLVDQGYGLAGPEFAAQLDQHGTLVGSFGGRSWGHLKMYDVRAYTGGSR
ncbi:hypothetical protein NUM3379_32740 [Kineococcus sp. NUM-3379]